MTLWFLSVSQHVIHFNIYLPIQFAAIFSISMWCGTLSKALAKSRYSVSTVTPFSIPDVTCSRWISSLVRYNLPEKIYADCISKEYMIPDVCKWHL